LELNFHEDSGTRAKITDFLRYSSTITEFGDPTSCKDYVEYEKDGEKDICYVTGTYY